eukprot:CAMPEP_0172021974 /NCGR_PEP_ID=MMETSP1041-20130122/14010_1 /TAXON_ID=464988 /ORGANISM="Hemiselmis andersenii, Strain CCMP439" /LENGTH=72 /DNA_ID=CAMNT_0012677359 /DNA_START=393 /DNA_END=607 /DNA_ORIENTATION=-
MAGLTVVEMETLSDGVGQGMGMPNLCSNRKKGNKGKSGAAESKSHCIRLLMYFAMLSTPSLNVPPSPPPGSP